MNATLVSFRYWTETKRIERETDSVETAILSYRKALRAHKVNRATRGTLEYKVGNGEWIKAN